MSNTKILRAVCSLGVLVTLMCTVASAQYTYDKRTYFTFNRPIALPGVTLPAGKYMFRLADPSGGRKVIEVSSADGTKHYAMLYTQAALRYKLSSKPEMRFMETGTDTPSAVLSWWYPGDSYGYEFIYPREQARLLVQASPSAEPILTTRAETTKAEDVKTGDLSRLTAAGSDVEPVAPTPDASAEAPPGVAEIGVVADVKLPSTGSELPLVGLIGLLAFAGAGAVRLRRATRRA